MMKPKETATIWVEWGYELRSLKLGAEGGFSDRWRFKGGIGGELRVTYCGDEEGSEGEGYIGSLTEDMIEIHLEE